MNTWTDDPRHFSFRDINERLDVLTVAEDHGFVVDKRSGANRIGDCLFKDCKKNKMSIHTTKQIYKCFYCGTGGRGAVKLVKELKPHMDWKEVKEYIIERYRDKL